MLKKQGPLGKKASSSRTLQDLDESILIMCIKWCIYIYRYMHMIIYIYIIFVRIVFWHPQNQMWSLIASFNKPSHLQVYPNVRP